MPGWSNLNINVIKARHPGQYLWVFLSIVLLGSGTLMFSPIVIPYTEYLGGLPIHGTLIESISKLIAGICVIYVGHISSLIGRKRSLVYIYIIGAAGIFLSGLAINPFWFFITNAIGSFSFASMSAVMMAYLLEIAPADQKAMGMGVFGIGIGVSSILGTILGTFVGEALGLRMPFFIAGLGPIIALVLIYRCFYDRTAGPSNIRARARGILGLKLFPYLIKINLFFIYLFIGALVYQFVQSSLSTLLTPYIMGMGYSLRIAGIGLGLCGVFGLLQPVGGKIGDIFGRKKILTVGAILFFSGMLSIYLAEVFGTIVLGTVLFGVGISLYVPCLTAEVGMLSPKDLRGAAMGSYQSMITLGSILGPLIGGGILQYIGPAAPFLFNSIISGLVFIMFLVMWQKY